MVKISLLDSSLIEQDWVDDDRTHCGSAHQCIVTSERRFPLMVSKMSVKQLHKCKYCGCTTLRTGPCVLQGWWDVEWIDCGCLEVSW